MSADLQITKSDSPDPVAVGQLLTYTLEVTNNGTDSATGVVATDTLPPTVTFVSASTSCTNDSGTVTCPLHLSGPMAPGIAVRRTITVAPNTAGTITNSVSVTGDQTDPVLANNTASETTTVSSGGPAITTQSSPDVTVGGSVSDTAVLAGASNPTGTITFRLYGPNDATCTGTPVFTDTKTVSGNGAYTSGSFTPPAAGTYRWTASYGGDANNAALGGACNDPNESVVVSAPGANLAIAKTDSPDPVAAGQPLTYSITVTNNGPLGATGVTVADPLPAGVTFGSATASQGSCNQASGTVTCDLGSLANGAQATVTIVVTPAADGSLSNTATVNADQNDPDTADNSATAATTVGTAEADLALTNVDAPDPVAAVQLLTYTLAVTDNGPDAASGVRVTDTLPGSVTIDVVTSSQGTCTGDAPITCNVGALDSGASATVTIKVRPSATGPL